MDTDDSASPDSHPYVDPSIHASKLEPIIRRLQVHMDACGIQNISLPFSSKQTKLRRS